MCYHNRRPFLDYDESNDNDSTYDPNSDSETDDYINNYDNNPYPETDAEPESSGVTDSDIHDLKQNSGVHDDEGNNNASVSNESVNNESVNNESTHENSNYHGNDHENYIKQEDE